MARIVGTVAGGNGAHAASFRTIEELLQTCASSSASIPIPPAATTTNEKMAPFVADAIAKGPVSDGRSGQEGACDAGLSHESTYFDRLQAPCAVGSCVPPVVSATTKAEMVDGVQQVRPSPGGSAAVCMTPTDSDSRGRSAPECDTNGDENGAQSPTVARFMSQQDGPALTDEQLLETIRRESPEARDHRPNVSRKETPTPSSDADVVSKFGPTLLEPGAVLTRGATTTTCSVVSANDDSRHGDAGRAHQGFLDQVASSAFPFTSSTNASSMGAVSGSHGNEGDRTHGSKRSDDASVAFKVDGQFSLSEGSSDMQADTSSCGVWSFCPTAPSNSPSMEQLLQRVCNATTKTEQAASPAGETRVWDGEGRALWEAAHLSVNAARLGGSADGCGSLGQPDAYSQLVALCNSSLSGALPAWQMLQSGNAPLPFGAPSADPRLAPCSVLLPGDAGCHVAAPGGENIVFGQRGALAEALPHVSGLQESLSPAQLTLLLQADLLRSQELLNHCGGVGGLSAADIEELLGRVRQLQGVTGVVNDLTLPEAPQDSFFGNLSQPQGFPFFCFPHAGAGNAAGMLLPKPEMGNVVHDFTKSQIVMNVRKAEAAAKKVRKEAGFTDSSQKKKPKKPKSSKDTSRAESPCPGSPKVVSRKKKGGSQCSSRKGSEASDASEVVVNSFANDLRAMTELASMTDADVAELEAEAFRRMSNRSKNAPPEVITALDFDGSLIRFSKVIGLHYHPKQNRWLAWRSQKGSKKVFKSFSTKKFGIAGARLMALRWRLGYGVVQGEGQDGLSDSNDILDDEQVQQSLSGDERYQLPLDAARLCDELSDTTATGGQGRSESSTPLNGQEMIATTPTTTVEQKAEARTTTSEQAKGQEEAGIKREEAVEEEKKAASSSSSSPVVPSSAASLEGNKLTTAAPLSSLISDRLGLLLGSITTTPADDFLTESDRSRLAALSLQGGGEIVPPSPVHKELCAG